MQIRQENAEKCLQAKIVVGNIADPGKKHQDQKVDYDSLQQRKKYSEERVVNKDPFHVLY
jgi:hypothetical protein